MLDCRVFIRGVYGRLGVELEEAGLIYKEDWRPKKRRKDWEAVDVEVVDLFRFVTGKCWGDPVSEMRAAQDAINSAVEKLPEEERYANQLLLSLHLFEAWLIRCGTYPDKVMWESRIKRLKDDVMRRVVQCSGEDVAKKSYTNADNIVRVLEGRPVLDEATRESAVELVMKRLKARAA